MLFRRVGIDKKPAGKQNALNENTAHSPEFHTLVESPQLCGAASRGMKPPAKAVSTSSHTLKNETFSCRALSVELVGNGK